MIHTFVHDARFLNKNDKYYAINLSKEVWEKRYLRYCDQLIVVGRSAEWKSEAGLVLSSCENVEFSLLPDFSKIKNLGRIGFLIKKMKEKIIISDLVIIRYPSILGMLALIICKRNNKPYILEVVGNLYDSFQGKGIIGKTIAHLVHRIIQKHIYNSSYVIYVTKYYLQNVYPSRNKSINCSNVNIEGVSDETVLKRKQRISHLCNTINLASVGGYEVQIKGLDTIIKALAMLDKGRNHKCYLIGSGNPENLKMLAKQYGLENNIIFTGLMEHDELMEFFDGIDIYIQASHTEGLPRTAIEAQSHGCVFIGSNVAGIPELAEKTHLFKPKNESELAIILNQIDKDYLKQHIDNAFIKASEYTISNLLEKKDEFMKEVYNDLKIN